MKTQKVNDSPGDLGEVGRLDRVRFSTWCVWLHHTLLSNQHPKSFCLHIFKRNWICLRLQCLEAKGKAHRSFCSPCQGKEASFRSLAPLREAQFGMRAARGSMSPDGTRRHMGLGATSRQCCLWLILCKFSSAWIRKQRWQGDIILWKEITCSKKTVHVTGWQEGETAPGPHSGYPTSVEALRVWMNLEYLSQNL
jgi:hypothetical protein